MSTDHGLRCLDHFGPGQDDMIGWAALPTFRYIEQAQALLRLRAEIVALADEFTDAGLWPAPFGPFTDSDPVEFLCEHRACRLVVVDEYGVTY